MTEQDYAFKNKILVFLLLACEQLCIALNILNRNWCGRIQQGAVLNIYLYLEIGAGYDITPEVTAFQLQRSQHFNMAAPAAIVHSASYKHRFQINFL